VILFWLVCLWLIAFTFVFVFQPRRALGQSRSGSTTTRANVDVYRDQLAELKAELHDQRITRERFLRDREELEHRLAGDLHASPSVQHGHATSPVMTMRWLWMMVSLAAVLLYLAIGSPSSLTPTR
jgi:cytochrome c-type biogenesis protein CcmI